MNPADAAAGEEAPGWGSSSSSAAAATRECVCLLDGEEPEAGVEGKRCPPMEAEAEVVRALVPRGGAAEVQRETGEREG